MTPSQRFSNRVEHYVRYRPGYPAEVLHCLEDEFLFSASDVVADVGSGTGIFSALLLRNGNTVYGIEPNDEMRAAAERLLSGFPRFQSVAGTSDDTTLLTGSVDWVVAAQAFHWFDVDRARREFARILRPLGPGVQVAKPRVAFIWNNRREDSPFLQDYEGLLHQFGTDYVEVKHQSIESDGRLDRFFGTGWFTRRSFDYRQSFDFEGMLGRTLSASYMPDEHHSSYPAMHQALLQLFDRHSAGGLVSMEYDTSLYVGNL